MRRSLAPGTRQQFADRVRQLFRKTAETIVEMGRALVEAKAALAHGEFTAMVEVDLGWNLSAAERLMAIARHPVISNPATLPSLPSGREVIYQLTQVSERTLTDAIREGAVHPGMTMKQARSLVVRDRWERDSRQGRMFAPEVEPVHSEENAPRGKGNPPVVVILVKEIRAALAKLPADRRDAVADAVAREIRPRTFRSAQEKDIALAAVERALCDYQAGEGRRNRDKRALLAADVLAFLLALIPGDTLATWVEEFVKRLKLPATMPSNARVELKERLDAERRALVDERESLVEQCNAAGVNVPHLPETVAKRAHEANLAKVEAARAEAQKAREARLNAYDREQRGRGQGVQFDAAGRVI